MIVPAQSTLVQFEDLSQSERDRRSRKPKKPLRISRDLARLETVCRTHEERQAQLRAMLDL